MKTVKENKVPVNILQRFFWTNRCRLCTKVIPVNHTLCEDCNPDKIRIPENFFTAKVYSAKTFDKITAPFFYKSPVREGIHNLKYKEFKRNAEYLAKEMIDVIERDFSDEEPDFITCVPMSKRRRKQKSYNQCDYLIRHIGKVFGIKPTFDLIIKTKDTPTQVNLKHKERMTNLKGAFTANKKYDIKNKTVLLCDDIITTGSTLSECSKALKKAGALRVICVTAAINHNDN